MPLLFESFVRELYAHIETGDVEFLRALLDAHQELLPPSL